MDIVPLDYDTARSQIKDGHILFYRGHTWFHKFVNWITAGEFTHCGIAVWMTDDCGRKKLMCVESSVGGARIVTVRAYAFRGMTVVDLGLDWNVVGDSPIDQTGSLHYNYMNFVLIGLKGVLLRAGLTRIASKIKPEHGKVCSEFVASYLMDAKILNDSFVSPNQLYRCVLITTNYQYSIVIAPQKIIVH